MDEQINKLNEKILKLTKENNNLNEMIGIMEKMSIDLIPVVMKCKCDYNLVKIKTNLNVLKLKYDLLKDIINNQNNDNFSHVKSNSNINLIEKINSCVKTVPKIVIKKCDSFDENFEKIKSIEENLNNQSPVIDDKNYDKTNDKLVVNQKGLH
jgi:DNA-binding protein YbaB